MMGFISDRLAAEAASDAYAKRLKFPGVDEDNARKASKALRGMFHRGFLAGVKHGRIVTTPDTALDHKAADDAINEILLHVDFDPAATEQMTTNATTILKTTHLLGFAAGTVYGRSHPR
jgi:hypothetical protein